MADKLLTIGEVVEKIKSGDPQFAELAAELANAHASFAKEDRSFDCRLCDKHFTPTETQWIFYNLCDRCFAEFNGQKMSGRFGPLPGRSPEPCYESCDEWLKNVS